GFKNAFNKHKEDETDYGAAGNLPAGIEGGIARLSKIEVKEFQTGKLKGKPYMSFTGVVVSPQKFTDSDGNVLDIAGAQTRLMPIPLCNTPDRQKKKSLDDHVADVLNELRKLGVDTAGMDAEDIDAV